MDKYLVFRPDAPTDDDRPADPDPADPRRGVDVLIVLSVSPSSTVDDRGFLVPPAWSSACFGGLLSLHRPRTALGEARGQDRRQRGLRRSRSTRSPRTSRCASRHPARFADNALRGPQPAARSIRRTSSMVSAAITRSSRSCGALPTASATGSIGYVGGIDMNRNRLDTPGHHGRAWRPPDQVSNVPSPQAFHDVHARITGPAAADVALTFDRRWDFDSNRQPPRRRARHRCSIVAFPTPSRRQTTDEVPPQPARHLVQVGRSGYAPEPGRRQHAAAVVTGRRSDHSRGDRSRAIDAGARVHLHRGPVLHPARRLHPRAARGVGPRTPACGC